MPIFTTTNGVALSYEEFGANKDQAKATIVLSHGYCVTRHLYDGVIEGLLQTKKEEYRIVSFDHRCHGDSAVVCEPFTMEDLVDDAIELLESDVVAGKGSKIHFFGMSMGGYVATRLVLKKPDLIASIGLIDTDGAAIGLVDKLKYNLMLSTLYWFGMFRFLIEETMRLQMASPFRTDPKNKECVDYWRDVMAQMDARGLYYFGKAIFGRSSILEPLKGNSIPSLIVIGELDIATPMHHSKALQEALPNSKLVEIPRAGHMAVVEQPKAVQAAMESFLMSLE